MLDSCPTSGPIQLLSDPRFGLHLRMLLTCTFRLSAACSRSIGRAIELCRPDGEMDMSLVDDNQLVSWRENHRNLDVTCCTSFPTSSSSSTRSLVIFNEEQPPNSLWNPRLHEEQLAVRAQHHEYRVTDTVSFSPLAIRSSF